MLLKINKNALTDSVLRVFRAHFHDFDENAAYSVYSSTEGGYIVAHRDYKNISFCFAPPAEPDDGDNRLCVYRNYYAKEDPREPRYMRVALAYSINLENKLSFCPLDYTLEDIDTLINNKIKQQSKDCRDLTKEELRKARFNLLEVIADSSLKRYRVNTALNYLVDYNIYPFGLYINKFCNGTKWLN